MQVLWQPHSDLGHFNNEVCYVVKIVVGESVPSMQLITADILFEPQPSGGPDTIFSVQSVLSS